MTTPPRPRSSVIPPLAPDQPTTPAVATAAQRATTAKHKSVHSRHEEGLL